MNRNLQFCVPSYNVTAGFSGYNTSQPVSSHYSCLSCLNNSDNFVYLSTCKHVHLLEYFYKYKIEYQSSVICQKCHYFLKRMGKFKQQVEHSLMILNKQGSNIEPLKTFRDLQLSETLILTYDKDQVVKDLIQTYTNVSEQPYNDLQTDLKIESEYSDDESFLPLSDIKEKENEKNKKKDKTKTKNKQKKKSSVFEKYEGKINIIYITDAEMHEERRQMATKESYLKLPYKCEKCITAFDHEITLKDHTEKRHKKKKNGWVCSICESVLVSEPSFKEHMKRHKRRYECQECGKRSTNVYSIIKHYNDQHGIIDAQYTCADCDFTTTSNRTYRYHRDKHKQKQQCTMCNNDFVNATSLKMHMLYVHKLSNRVYKCEECDKVYHTKSGIAAHKATAHSNKRGYCAPCGTYYRTANSLAHHLRTHSAHVTETDKRFICDDCGSKFLNKSTLQAHIDFVHLKNTKYKCTKCPKVFISGPALKKHENFVHEKIRPPRNKICHHCGRGFTTSTILRSHVRTHTGERPLQCTHCTATFAHSAALYTHTKLLHAPNKGKK